MKREETNKEVEDVNVLPLLNMTGTPNQSQSEMKKYPIAVTDLYFITLPYCYYFK